MLNILIALAWSRFAYINIQEFIWTGDPLFLLITLAQAEFALLILIRSDANSSTKNPLDYILAFCGTFAVFLYSPHSHEIPYLPGYYLVGSLLVYAGLMFEIFGFLSLNTSAGIVPSNRGVKTSGIYAYIRHPIYLGSMFLFLGYFVLNPLQWNMVILIWAAIFQILRIQREESLLMEDEHYKKYSSEVRWKLLPGIY